MKLKDLYYLSEAEIIVEIEISNGVKERFQESHTVITNYGDLKVLSISVSPDGRIIATV